MCINPVYQYFELQFCTAIISRPIQLNRELFDIDRLSYHDNRKVTQFDMFYSRFPTSERSTIYYFIITMDLEMKLPNNMYQRVKIDIQISYILE